MAPSPYGRTGRPAVASSTRHVPASAVSSHAQSVAARRTGSPRVARWPARVRRQTGLPRATTRGSRAHGGPERPGPRPSTRRTRPRRRRGHARRGRHRLPEGRSARGRTPVGENALAPNRPWARGRPTRSALGAPLPRRPGRRAAPALRQGDGARAETAAHVAGPARATPARRSSLHYATMTEPSGPLRRLIDVRPGEVAALLWASLFYFCVLCAYYVIRPIRDDMGVAGGVDNLPWLFTGTLVGDGAGQPAVRGAGVEAAAAEVHHVHVPLLRGQPADLLRAAAR